MVPSSPLPAEVVQALGGHGRIPVRATFDGIAYQGSVVSMGGQKVIGLLKAIRTELGKGPGDVITVTLEVDCAERTVEVPDDLRAALEQAGRTQQFNALSFSHRREYVTGIIEAKKPEHPGAPDQPDDRTSQRARCAHRPVTGRRRTSNWS